MPKVKLVFIVFLLLVAYGVVVQILGSFAYNGMSWNWRRAALIRTPTMIKNNEEGKIIFEEDLSPNSPFPQGTESSTILCNVDEIKHRHRLWSLVDSQIVYYWRYFAKGRKIRKDTMEEILAFKSQHS